MPDTQYRDTEDAVDQNDEAVEEATHDVADGTDNEAEESDTFPRDYVEKLRKENAKYRERAQQSDALAERLHTALVAATGRLADASDLPYDEAHLDDDEALTTAIEDLLTRKPHLASRKPTGDVGQGVGTTSQNVDLAGILRAGAA